MPLYEFECITCRNQILDSLKVIEKTPNLKTIKSVLKKHSHIKAIVLADLIKEEEIASAGKFSENLIDIDLYIEDGKKMVLFSVDNFRFSELILDKEDEKKVECNFGFNLISFFDNFSAEGCVRLNKGLCWRILVCLIISETNSVFECPHTLHHMLATPSSIFPPLES